ncbi:MAG TPA: OsmC family protein [Gemmatimonadaceae bacterium]|nr:OsmC family protein [Gemmatimonadaceae bacterium]
MTEHATSDAAAPAPTGGKPPSRVLVRWKGEGTMAFEGRKAKGGPTITVDNTGKAEPGPVDTLLIALAACTSEDVLSILEKRRTPATRLDIEVEGKRANGVPARLTDISLRYVVDGDGIDRANTLRAIELAVTKYCSVRDSLDKSIDIEWSLRLNGADE